MSLLNPSGGNTSSDTILWKTDNAVSINSDWIMSNARMLDDGIEMDANNSAIMISVPIDNLKVENAKFRIELDSDDDTLTTNGVNNVVGLAKFYYGSDTDENALDVATESFYPKYIFEDDFVQDFTVIPMQGGRELKRVDMLISNTERSAVKIKDVSLTFNQDKGGEVSAREFNSLSNRVANTEKGLARLVIPLWTDDFLVEHGMGATLKDGEIGRMENMSEFSYIYTDDTVIETMKQYETEIEDIEYRLWVAQMAGDDTTGLAGLLMTKRREYQNYMASIMINKNYENK